MDSTKEYTSGPVVGLGSNWQPHLIQYNHYPPPAITSLQGAGPYSPYGSQETVTGPNQTAPTPSLYPLNAGFAALSPSIPVPTESLEHLKQTLQEIRKLPQMADPLSLMASLIAVATAGYQVADTLYKLADAIGNANEEIVSIGREIRAFSRVLDDLRDFLDDAKDLISKNALENANVMVADCKHVFAKIERMLGFCNASPRMNFWHSLQWSFRREKVKPMCARLESFKSTLALLLMTLKLAKCKKDIVEGKSSNSSGKEQRYRASLETDIINNSAAITRWQRVEVESKSGYGANPYSAPNQASLTPSKELQWLSNLVPFKPLHLQSGPPAILSLPPIPEAKDSLNQQAESQKVQIVKTVDVLLAKWTTLNALKGRPKKPGQVENVSLASHDGPEMKSKRKAAAEDVSERCADCEDVSGETKARPSTDLESISSLTNETESAPTRTDAVDDNETNEQDVNGGSRESQISSPTGRLSENPGVKTTYNGNSNLDGDGDEPMRAEDLLNIKLNNFEGISAAQTESGHLQIPPSPSTVQFELPPDLDWPLCSPAESGKEAAHPPISPPELVDSVDEFWVHSHTPRRPSPPPSPPPPMSSTGGFYPYGSSTDPLTQGNARSYYGPPPAISGQLPYCPPPTTGYAQTIYAPPSMSQPGVGSGPGHPNGFYSVPYPQQPAFAQGPNDLEQKWKDSKQELVLEGLVKKVENMLLDFKQARQNHDDELTAAKRTERDGVDEESLDKRTIGFQDAVGTIFTFPYQKCKKWVDMKSLVEQTVADVELIGERVRRSHYDLLDPSGAVILPSLWETLLEPYWTIKMMLWPCGEQSLPEKPLPQRRTMPRQMTSANEEELPPQPPPSVPIAPSAAPKPQFPSAPRERIVVEEISDGVWPAETSSETRSTTTDECSDESTHKSTCQYRLSESFQKYGQQFEETWEAVMARSRLKAQTTILETWLSENEAELRKLDPSPSRDQRTSELGPKATVMSEEISAEDNNDGTVSVPGQKSQDGQARKALPQPDREGLIDQTLPRSPAPSHSRTQTLCETCHSPLLLTSSNTVVPEIHRISSLKPSSAEMVAISPQHILPRSSFEQRLEMLEDLIRRQEADRKARLDNAKAAENEQRLSRLERTIVQADVQIPPLNSEPLRDLPDIGR